MAEIGAQIWRLQSPFIVSFWLNIPGALDFSGRGDGVCEAAWCIGKEPWIWSLKTIFLILTLYDLGQVTAFWNLKFFIRKWKAMIFFEVISCLRILGLQSNVSCSPFCQTCGYSHRQWVPFYCWGPGRRRLVWDSCADGCSPRSILAGCLCGCFSPSKCEKNGGVIVVPVPSE